MAALTITRQLVLFLLGVLSIILAHSQQVDSASLRGIVRDSQGNPVAGATLSLEAKDSKRALNTRTDSQGSYRFIGLESGVYTLRAEMSGYGKASISSLFLAPNEAKFADVSLLPETPPAAQDASSTPQFFDPPTFTVSGVTDTTSLGGHGSDTMARAHESIAKETAALGKPAVVSSPAASAALEKSLRERVERGPRSLEANQQLGEVLIREGRAREAIPYLERAAELSHGSYQNSYELAIANFEAGNYARSRDLTRILLAANDRAELHHLLADSDEKLGDSLEALRQYQRAAELDPSESNFFDWGSELLLHHAPEPATEVFGKGNQLYPHSTRMLLGLGASWFSRGSYDQAVERICQASDLNPNDQAPYVFLGKIQRVETKPSANAIEKLHRFVTLEPDNAQANYYYAVGLWKLRTSAQDPARPSQVESLLSNAIRLDPKLGEAYLQRGILRDDQKDDRAAIADYQSAIRTNPQLAEAHYRLAQAYRQIGQIAEEKTELQLYDQMVKESSQQADREHHEIRQFVYTLRNQPPPQTQ